MLVEMKQQIITSFLIPPDFPFSYTIPLYPLNQSFPSSHCLYPGLSLSMSPPQASSFFLCLCPGLSLSQFCLFVISGLSPIFPPSRVFSHFFPAFSLSLSASTEGFLFLFSLPPSLVFSPSLSFPPSWAFSHFPSIPRFLSLSPPSQVFSTTLQFFSLSFHPLSASYLCLFLSTPSLLLSLSLFPTPGIPPSPAASFPPPPLQPISLLPALSSLFLHAFFPTFSLLSSPHSLSSLPHILSPLFPTFSLLSSPHSLSLFPILSPLFPTFSLLSSPHSLSSLPHILSPLFPTFSLFLSLHSRFSFRPFSLLFPPPQNVLLVISKYETLDIYPCCIIIIRLFPVAGGSPPMSVTSGLFG
ncbi:unnamed protein product [Acanthosepion pharaonis]|uniref:Uncharacterized protein n=1 Tax=Acanthosepion pharaonis TaxID=158019 RepID=A0A812BEF5_ACAPH|nr:unnamed protein product [Sepia pharaonis]